MPLKKRILGVVWPDFLWFWALFLLALHLSDCERFVSFADAFAPTRAISTCSFRGRTRHCLFATMDNMKTSVYIAVTVDGFIATAEGDVSFLEQYHGSPSSVKNNKYDFESFMNSVDVIIMGRKSFEKVLSFGPEMWAYGKTRIIVWTRQQNGIEIPSHLKDQVSCSSEPPLDLLSQLSSNNDDGERSFNHAYIDGGQTIQSFLEVDAVSQLIVTRVPLLLGQGIPLFNPNSPKSKNLEHQETIDLGNGLITSCYTVVSD